ncbi:hypothetical protein Taro_033486 [Colocasia esculenta]|uniref:Uncharacterized protein n=1 Tax=Colocasia esculenta TaxID=4460 RepID=A0A843VNW8_COLES|nr:hypothetical protein [Colocasia esculenta]
MSEEIGHIQADLMCSQEQTVDTRSSGVDTMLQTPDKIMQNWSGSVDTSSGATAAPIQPGAASRWLSAKVPMGPRRTHYPPLPETLSDIFLALLSTDAIRLPPERPLNPSVDQTRYCVFHRQPGHTIDQCFTFKDLVYDLHEQHRIDWTALRQVIGDIKER